MIPRHKIFVSSPLDDYLEPRRLAIKKAILAALTAEGFELQIFFHSGLPASLGWNFEHANRVMSQCQAAVVLAFVRWQGTDTHDRTMSLASEFSHFEGALAVAHDLPLLVVSEKGIADRGIASMGGGLPIHFIPTGAESGWVSEPWFATRLAAWAKDVKSRPRVFLGYCGVGSSRVDLQACKLEYSIVSPK